LKITILGTGTSPGVPVIGCRCAVCRSDDVRDQRLRSSILVESGTTRAVIDTGPDFRQQMLRAGVDRLDGIVYTHEHRDHVAGLDDIRALNFIQREPMHLYATAQVEQAIRQSFPYIFGVKDYPGLPEIEFHRINDRDAFKIGDISFQPVLVWHYKLPVLAFRIGDFTYITDANRIDPPELDKIRGSRIVVINALRHEKHISHFTLAEAVALLEELKPDTGFLTHISHQLGCHEDIEKELPGWIHPAFDGLTLTI